MKFNRQKPFSPEQKRIEQVFKRSLGITGQRVSMAEAMREQNYSHKMTRNPQEVTKTKTWAILMEEYFPEDALAKKHKELLNAGTLQKMRFAFDIEDSEIKDILSHFPGAKFIKVDTVDKDGKKYKRLHYIAPDTRIQKDMLDMSYKIRGNYAPEKHETKNLHLSLADLRQMRIEGLI